MGIARQNLVVMIGALLLGCDQSQSTNAPALLATTEPPLPSVVELEALATLPAHRATQVIATTRTLYVLQADESASVVNEVVGGRIIPTALTADAIATSMSLPRTRGQITSIAADGDRVAFCFAGVNGQVPVAAVGTFNPATGDIFTTVDTISLQQVDSELITTRVRPYLFVAGEMAWVVRVENASIRIVTIRHLRALQPELSLRTVDLGPIQDAITRSAWDFSPASPPGTFYLTDTASRWVRTLDSTGAVRHVARFDQTISTISPVATDAAGRVIVLASDRDGVNITMLVQNGEAFRALPVEGFRGQGIQTRTLRIDRLYPLPDNANQFVGYDGTSGKILRITLK